MPETGDVVWTRPVIEGHVGTYKGQPSTMTGTLNATWPGDLWKTGGGATWLGGSYDAETDTLVFGAGNPSPWNSHLRGAGTPAEGNKGDNLYAASRLGLDPATGEIKWHFQTTPREGWTSTASTRSSPIPTRTATSATAPPTATASSTC